MNKLIILIAIFSFETIAADKSFGVIDLRDKRENLHKYWITPYYAAPRYPTRALERGLTGCVGFSYIISNGGRARDIKLTGWFPNNLFVENARVAVEKYRWNPSQIILRSLQL